MAKRTPQTADVWFPFYCRDWLADLKGRIHNAQQRATLAVNSELVLLY